MFRTDVRIHWSLPAYFLYYLLRSSNIGYAPSTLLMWVVLPMVLLFASVICHEFGHVFAARRLGQRTGSMVLTPIGGMVMVAEGPTPRAEFVVAAAGPLVNLCIALAFGALYLGSGGSFDLGLISPFGAHSLLGTLWQRGAYVQFALADVVQTNIILFLFNVLLVAYPLDGGRMLFSFLWKRRGRRRGLALACRVAQGLAIAMGVFGLVAGHTGLVVIGLLVFFQALSTERQIGMIMAGGFGDALPPRGAPSRPNFLQRWRKKRRGRQRARARMKDVEKHDTEVGPLPPEIMDQVREAMGIGQAGTSRDEPNPKDPDALGE